MTKQLHHRDDSGWKCTTKSGRLHIYEYSQFDWRDRYYLSGLWSGGVFFPFVRSLLLFTQVAAQSLKDMMANSSILVVVKLKYPLTPEHWAIPSRILRVKILFKVADSIEYSLLSVSRPLCPEPVKSQVGDLQKYGYVIDQYVFGWSCNLEMHLELSDPPCASANAPCLYFFLYARSCKIRLRPPDQQPRIITWLPWPKSDWVWLIYKWATYGK